MLRENAATVTPIFRFPIEFKEIDTFGNSELNPSLFIWLVSFNILEAFTATDKINRFIFTTAKQELVFISYTSDEWHLAVFC